MILERTEHPEWLSNAYLVADREGGHGVLVDSNGINQPLIDAVERLGITVTHVLVTHSHHDHVVTCEDDARRFDVHVLAHPLARAHGVHVDETIEDGDVVRSGDLEIRAIGVPGHSDDQIALLVRRHRLPDDGLPVQGDDRRLQRPRPGVRDPSRLDHGQPDGTPARDDVSTPATRCRRRSPRSGSRTRSSGSGAGSIPRVPSRAPLPASKLPSSSGAPTTTARTRRGSGSRTAIRSWAGPASRAASRGAERSSASRNAVAA